MRANISEVEASILSQLGNAPYVSEEKIRGVIELKSQMFTIIGEEPPLTEKEKLYLIRSIQNKLAVQIDHGACVKIEHTPWFGAAMREKDRKYWNRYEKYLKTKFGRNVINELDRTSDEIMDLLGNPQDLAFQRKGLIIGDVQSGKTAMYTAIMNKAADAGYKVVILLTGIIEKLRKQTQGRIDSDFVGADSSLFRKNNGKISKEMEVGVGVIDKEVSVYSMTSTTDDFKSNITNSLSSISDPVLFVVKKNKAVLTRLEKWLKSRNLNAQGKITYPMLLIDDEADNASVNTKSDNQDPTAINACINCLLKLFTRSNYLGVTATPYANIFINSDTKEDMLRDDLFPRDFIYAMSINSNYIGARDIFRDDGKHNYMLRYNDDCEDFLPLSHKTNDHILDLPDSLKEALASFFIINAIRDLDGESITHRSMLINISRFIRVHESIHDVVCDYVNTWKAEIRNYYKFGERAQQYETFSFFKEVFYKHFSKWENELKNVQKYTWEDIRQVLGPAVSDISVRVVNGGNAAKQLDYEDHKATGLRVIAIGGMSLSRGLTLEGLCVSYFYRNSKMYDTLMQMGRWFGYRDSYSHLCQIWMGESMIEWYRYISEATDDLRDQVKRMQNDKRTPDDFGLAVRSDMAALLVTARNKMRTASDFSRTISFSGKVVEMPYLHFDSSLLTSNFEILSKWVKDLDANNYRFEKKIPHLANPEVPLIKDVPLSFIKELLSVYNVHSLNLNFNTSDLLNIISKENSIFQKWDVAIATTTKDKTRLTTFLGTKIIPIERSFYVKEERKAIQMTSRIRLGSTNFAKTGLLESDIRKIEKLWEESNPGKAVPERVYFDSGIERNPLLIIYPISLMGENKSEEIKVLPPIITGLAIGIPRIDGVEDITWSYKMNKRKFQELVEIDNFDSSEEIDESIEDEHAT